VQNYNKKMIYARGRGIFSGKSGKSRPPTPQAQRGEGKKRARKVRNFNFYTKYEG
jgi:hypothetical protein